MNQDLEESALNYIKLAVKVADLNNLEIETSHSGGIDSVVINHLANRCGVKKSHFFNTGVEHKENLKFIKTVPNVTKYTPKMSFKEFVYHYGFPIGGKEKVQGIQD